MQLSHLPERENKPRTTGINMVMDKGLSVGQAKEVVEACGHLIDFLKLGFGTSLFTRNVKEKIKVYQDAGCKVYVGGTLFEAFVVRGQFDKYVEYIDQLGVDAAEVSDGSIIMAHEKKCEYINILSRNRTVVSEVGAKSAEVILEQDVWKKEMKKELDAGSSFVIGEARESGTVGIYSSKGESNPALINDILSEVPSSKIIWEAPLKTQQVWFIKQQGPQVNLGNIAPSDVIPLETLRNGLRGDTFFDFLPESFLDKKLK